MEPVAQVVAVQEARVGAARKAAASVAWKRNDIATNSASVSGFAMRVSARALAYDSLPVFSAWSMAGSLPSARATRTFSRAVAGAQPTRHANQWAHDIAPCWYQPPASSKCRMHSSSLCVAASMCTARTAIS